MWRIRAARERWVNTAAQNIAWLLPRRVVEWCYIRVAAYATTGQYGNTVVTELSMMDAIKRWDGG